MTATIAFLIVYGILIVVFVGGAILGFGLARAADRPWPRKKDNS